MTLTVNSMARIGRASGGGRHGVWVAGAGGSGPGFGERDLHIAETDAICALPIFDRVGVNQAVVAVVRPFRAVRDRNSQRSQ